MQSRSNASKAGLLMKWLVPIGISALSIYLLAGQINPQDLVGALKSIPFLPLFLSIVCNIAGMLLRALAWNRILGHNFDFKTSFFAMCAGYLLNNILPFRLGEFGRAALLTGKDKNKAPFMQVFASIITERTLDIFIASLLFLVTLPLVVSQNSLKTLAYIALFFTITILVIGAIGSKNQAKVKAWIVARKFLSLEKREKLANRLTGFLEGFKIFLKPKQAILAFSLLFLSWMMAIVQLWLVQQPLLAHGKFWWTLFVTSAGAFVNALPSAPAGLGVFEAGVVSAYRLIGEPQSVALALALTLHATTFILTSLFGLVGLSLLGENLKSLFNKANRGKTLEVAAQ